MILAWLLAEDDGAKKKIVSLLADRDEDLSLIRGTLKGMSYGKVLKFSSLTKVEQLEGLGEEEPGHEDFKDMLTTLLQFL